MKLFTNIAAVLTLSLPLIACNGGGGLFGDPRPPSNGSGSYQSQNRYPNRPVTSVATDSNYQGEAVAQKNKKQSDVTMVEHGNSTTVNPKPVTVGKGVVTHEGPMVPGDAPSVQ